MKNYAHHNIMKIAILIEDGMVKQVIGDDSDVQIEMVDADFKCCNPMEKWNELKVTHPIELFIYK